MRRAVAEKSRVPVHDKRADAVSFKERREPSLLEEAGMGSGKETTFENVNEVTINAGEVTATVSGKLFSEGGVPVEGVDVLATLKTPPSKADVTTTATTDSGGGFNAVFKDLNLPKGF